MSLWQVSRLAALLMIFLLSACAAQSPQDALTTEVQTITSWVATAQTVGDAWMHESVPTVYAKQTLEATQQSLQDEQQNLAPSAIAPEQQAALLQQLQTLQQMIARMLAAVEQGNRATMAQQVQALSAQQQQLSALAQKAGAQP